MVKADVRRDYYADLGVSPSADTDEIKKQFRRLALKYHPDRNPGRETEFNSKFQAIQAAHEILTDPQQRLKYDTERLRAGYGKLYGPPPTNAPRRTNTSSHPAPSPGRAPTAKAAFPQRPTHQPPPSTGAQRYASYAKAAPQQPWTWEKWEAQTRADAFRGFQEMKPGAGTPSWSKFDPRTGKPTQQTGRSTPTAMPTGQTPRTKSAYEYFSAKPAPTGPSRSQSTRKKQGFAPGTPGGDEPMARNVSAYASVRTDRSSAFFDSVPSPTAKKKSTPASSRPASPQEEYVSPGFERTSSRYANTPGERTYFSSAGLGRSTSMRDSPGDSRARSRTNPPSPTSPVSSRHHSASPKLKTSRDRRFSSSTSSSDLSEEDEPLLFRPRVTPRSRLRPKQKFSASKDFHPGSGEDSPGRMNAPRFRDYLRSRNRFGSSRPHSYHDYVDPNTDSDYHQGHDSDPSSAFTYRSEHPFPAAEASKYDTKPGSSNGERNSHIFGESKTYANGGPRSRSHEQLNKGFSAREWNGTFDGGNYFSPNASSTSPTRGRSTSRPDSASQPSAKSSSEDSSRPHQPMPFAPAKFSADAWAQQLQDNTWAVPHNDVGKQQANTRPLRSTRKQSRSTPKPATQPQPATVSTEAEEAEATLPGTNNRAFAGATPAAPEAMEIDEEPPIIIEVTPVNGVPKPPPAPAESNKSASRPSPGNGGKANGTKNDLFDLKTLNNVTPLASTNSGGIDDLKDIHATLPFESRPNNPNVGRRVVRPRELALPNPPKRPRRPTVVPAGTDPRQMVLPQRDWERYMAEMSAYMREWNLYNRRMLTHFNARQDAVETGLAPRWISAVGDSTRLHVNAEDGGRDGSEVDNSDDNLIPGQPTGGFNAYLRGVEEDFKVREHWEVSWERHRECIVELGELRDWVRKGGKLV